APSRRRVGLGEARQLLPGRRGRHRGRRADPRARGAAAGGRGDGGGAAARAALRGGRRRAGGGRGSEPVGPARPAAPRAGGTGTGTVAEAPRREDDPTVELEIVLDEQDTIELAAAELHEAARAAGVPVVAPNGTDGTVTPDEKPSELTDEELATLDPM